MTLTTETNVDADPVQPFSLLIDPSSCVWWELVEALVEQVVAADAMVRIKQGLVLAPTDQRRASVTMGPYDDTMGRRLHSARLGTLPWLEEAFLTKLRDQLDPFDASEDLPTISDLFRAECISFSAVDDGLAARLYEIASSSAQVFAAVRWDPDSQHAGNGLWHHLILTTMVTRGQVMVDYEDHPESVDYGAEDLRWTPDRRPERPGAGFFFDFGAGPIVEPAFRDVPLPPDLNVLPLKLPRKTPLQVALTAAGTAVVRRISDHDDQGADALFRLPMLHFQYPDLSKVRRKIQDYCLNRSHQSQKWTGFMAHGYGTRTGDDVLLTGYIASALLAGFEPLDVAATSNGELQFGVQVVVPSRYRYWMPLTTSWIAEPDAGFRLVSAYVNAGSSRYAAPFEVVRPELPLVAAWPHIVAQAHASAGGRVSDGARAVARIYIPRSGDTRELALALARSGQSEGTFSRAALGGRSLLVALSSTSSWSEAALITAAVQTQLATRSVRTLDALWVD